MSYKIKNDYGELEVSNKYYKYMLQSDKFTIQEARFEDDVLVDAVFELDDTDDRNLKDIILSRITQNEDQTFEKWDSILQKMNQITKEKEEEEL